MFNTLEYSIALNAIELYNNLMINHASHDPSQDLLINGGQGVEMNLIEPTRRGLLIGTALMVLGGASLVACTDRNTMPDASASQEQLANPEVGLAAIENWQMAGVSVGDNGGVKVSPIDRSIVKQDGSEGYDNPAVNLSGSMLEITGDFKLTAKVTLGTGESAISIYGRPPIVSDEFRAPDQEMRVAIAGSKLSAARYDGKHGEKAAAKGGATFNRATDNKTTLTISRLGDKVQVVVDGHTVTLPAGNLFKNGTVWLGMDANGDNASAFTLDSLKADGINGGTTKVRKGLERAATTEKDPTGLQSLVEKAKPANPDFKIGYAGALGPLVSDAQYTKLALGGNFGSVTPENALKMQFVQPKRGVYTFEEADAIVDIARKNNQQIHGHVAVFGEANPQWVRSLSKEERRAVLQDHVRTVAEHYKGKITTWDLNEVLADYDTEEGEMGLRKNIWYDAYDGHGYITEVVKILTAVDPNNEIVINDFGMESDTDRLKQALNIASMAKDAGAKKVAIGFQSHLDDGDADANGLIDVGLLAKNFKMAADQGVDVRISELDVDSISYQNFAEVLKVALNAPNCLGVTMWGITDKFSSGAWIESGRLELGEGLPWNSDYGQTAAVAGMKRVLQDRAN
jgi:endo-1,4-beta-xylanase